MKILFFSLILSGIVNANNLVLKDVNVIDVVNLKIINNQTIWIKDNIIETVIDNKHAKKLIPKGLPTLELSGHYISPGLIDTHVHHATDPENNDEFSVVKKHYKHYLRNGITSVRDMGGDARILNSYQRSAKINQFQSPEIYYSVIIAGAEFFDDPRTISSAKGGEPGNESWMRAINSKTDWKDVISQAKGIGATGIKIYRKLPADVLEPITKEAKRQGLQVWSHTFIEPAMPNDAIQAGVNVMSHADGISGINKNEVSKWLENNNDDSQWHDLLNQQYIDKVLDQMLENDVILDATLVVFQQLGQDSKLMETRYKMAQNITKSAYEKGVKISTGTDFPVKDIFNEKPKVFTEIELLINEVGMKPIESIQAATFHGALALGLAETHGEVSNGKIANLVIYKNNPVTDVSQLTTPAHVIKNGHLVYRGTPSELPFSNTRVSGHQLWLSGQLGNLPGTKILAGDDISSQMQQTMKNIGHVLTEYNLSFNELFKCTLMLDDINDWAEASEIYKKYFMQKLPARSAFATDGLALGAKVEVECIANLN